MNKLITFVVIFLATATLVFAQTWCERFPYSVFASSVIQTTGDSGLIAAGNGFIFKANIQGVSSWMQQPRSDSILANPLFSSVRQTLDGGFIAVGQNILHQRGGALIMKTNSQGDTLWSRWFRHTNTRDSGFSVFNDVRQLPNGNFIATGLALQLIIGTDLVKLSSDGNPIWRRNFGRDSVPSSFGALHFHQGLKVQLTPDGGFVVLAALVDCNASYYGSVIVRCDSLGDTLWTHAFVQGYYSYYNVMALDNDGGIILARALNDTTIDLAKLSSLGDTVWTRNWHSNLRHNVVGVALVDSGFVITGSAQSSSGSNLQGDGFLVKFNSAGEFVWRQAYSYNDGVHYNALNDVVGTADGGLAMAGVTYSDSNQTHFLWLVKTDADGNVLVSSIKPLPLATLPQSFTVLNYPNPFNPITTILFLLPKASPVKLTVFDATGREVKQLINSPMKVGSHSIQFDGSRLSSGVYFYRLQAGEFTATRKMVLMK